MHAEWKFPRWHIKVYAIHNVISRLWERETFVVNTLYTRVFTLKVIKIMNRNMSLHSFQFQIEVIQKF